MSSSGGMLRLRRGDLAACSRSSSAIGARNTLLRRRQVAVVQRRGPVGAASGRNVGASALARAVARDVCHRSQCQAEAPTQCDVDRLSVQRPATGTDARTCAGSAVVGNPHLGCDSARAVPARSSARHSANAGRRARLRSSRMLGGSVARHAATGRARHDERLAGDGHCAGVKGCSVGRAGASRSSNSGGAGRARCAQRRRGLRQPRSARGSPLLATTDPAARDRSRRSVAARRCGRWRFGPCHDRTLVGPGGTVHRVSRSACARRRVSRATAGRGATASLALRFGVRGRRRHRFRVRGAAPCGRSLAGRHRMPRPSRRAQAADQLARRRRSSPSRLTKRRPEPPDGNAVRDPAGDHDRRRAPGGVTSSVSSVSIGRFAW